MRKLVILSATVAMSIFSLYGQTGAPAAFPDTALPALQIEYYNQLGKDYYHEGEFADALLSFIQALTVAESIDDSAYMAKLNSNIGVINDMVGNYAEALLHFQKSLLIYEKLDNIKGKESVLNNMGVVYEEMDMPEKALVNYFLSLQIKQQQGDKKSIAGTYNNIAIIYENFLDNSDSAYYFYNKALNCFMAAGDEQGVALLKSNLGIIHLRKGEPEQARHLINQSLEIFKRSGNTAEIANILYFLGKISFAETNYDEALNYFLKARELAGQHKIKKLQSRIYFDMAQTYKKQNKYEQALSAYEKYAAVKDKLTNREKVKQIKVMEMSYDVAKTEQEMVLLERRAEMKSREIVWWKRMILALLLIMVLGIIIAILNRHKNLIKKKQELLLLQSRLFRSQTAPHFIFNSLMSIETFLLEHKVDAALEYLVDFAKLIRSILQNTRKSFIPLDQEIETLKQYVNLECLRFNDKFDVDFQVHVSETEEILFPPMIAQPFIENAIQHGLVPAGEKGLLKIEFTEKNNRLILIIEDNGIGRQQSALKQKNTAYISMATEITNQRIRLMAKGLKKKISFKIEDLADAQGQPAGTRVIFEMALD